MINYSKIAIEINGDEIEIELQANCSHYIHNDEHLQDNPCEVFVEEIEIVYKENYTERELEIIEKYINDNLELIYQNFIDSYDGE